MKELVSLRRDLKSSSTLQTGSTHGPIAVILLCPPLSIRSGHDSDCRVSTGMMWSIEKPMAIGIGLFHCSDSDPHPSPRLR